MDEARPSWRRNALVLGPLVGWLVGVLWWTGLAIAFGPSVVVTQDGERTITVTSRLMYAPVVAIPWAVVGMLVGAINTAAPGPWVPVAAAIGTLVGGGYHLASSPFDGWLVLTMPFWCLGGGVMGAIAGVVLRALWPPNWAN